MICAQIAVYKKGEDKYNGLVDIFESENPNLLLRCGGIDIESLHHDHEFLMCFIESVDGKESRHTRNMEVTWGIPKRCRKARPCVSPDGELIDLLKFLKSVLVSGEYDIFAWSERKTQKKKEEEEQAVAREATFAEFNKLAGEDQEKIEYPDDLPTCIGKRPFYGKDRAYCTECGCIEVSVANVKRTPDGSIIGDDWCADCGSSALALRTPFVINFLIAQKAVDDALFGERYHFESNFDAALLACRRLLKERRVIRSVSTMVA